MRFFAGVLAGVSLASSVAAASGGFGSIEVLRAEIVQIQHLAQQVPQEPLRREMRWRLANLDAQLVGLRASLPPEPPRTDAWGPPSQGGPRWGPGAAWGAPAVCSEGEISSLVRAVSEAPFESDRLAVVQSAATGRWFTTAQVIRLVEAVSFADTGVEVAATLYPRVVDPERWYLVYAEIPFSSSREALRRRTR